MRVIFSDSSLCRGDLSPSVVVMPSIGSFQGAGVQVPSLLEPGVGAALLQPIRNDRVDIASPQSGGGADEHFLQQTLSYETVKRSNRN